GTERLIFRLYLSAIIEVVNVIGGLLLRAAQRTDIATTQRLRVERLKSLAGRIDRNALTSRGRENRARVGRVVRVDVNYAGIWRAPRRARRLRLRAGLLD